MGSYALPLIKCRNMPLYTYLRNMFVPNYLFKNRISKMPVTTDLTLLTPFNHQIPYLQWLVCFTVTQKLPPSSYLTIVPCNLSLKVKVTVAEGSAKLSLCHASNTEPSTFTAPVTVGLFTFLNIKRDKSLILLLTFDKRQLQLSRDEESKREKPY